MGSLQDALLKSGLADEKQAKKPRRKHSGAAHSGSVRGKSSGQRSTPHRDQKTKNAANKRSATSDLEQAYRAREQAEKQEKEDKKQARIAAQEARRKRNNQLDTLVKGKTLNRKNADMPRYFEHMGRIRRVLCSAEQREQLNNQKIGVVNLRGSYLLLDLVTLDAYQAIAPDLVPDLSPKEPDDDGSHYPQVPDDLIW